MALVLRFNICTEDNCKRFVFTETTGVYNATTNPTGYNAPNPLIASATSATLDVYLPSNTTTTPDLTVDMFAESYPTVVDTFEYTIYNSDLGFSAGTKMTDGFYKFVYTVVIDVSGTPTTFTQTVTKALSCNAACCVDGLFGEIPDFECDCAEAAINKALTAQAIYKAMVSAGACGNKTKYTKLQSMLSRMCNNTNCCS